MKFRAAWLVVVMALMAGSAQAAPVLIVSGGILQGATGVVVGGGTYDVSFVDGTCAALFTGCDEVTDFPFQTTGAATDAAQALLDSVFLEGVSGISCVKRVDGFRSVLFSLEIDGACGGCGKPRSVRFSKEPWARSVRPRLRQRPCARAFYAFDGEKRPS